ncbi:hypothetical protein BKA62DRAFT_693851 [Auriculariales sp. MPI-PUGE-AT-0066]|nr:hypothetical protein BKA62DRAFT_693851 [Auriculariales sp. MPI-PUGE-AT-0066]
MTAWTAEEDAILLRQIEVFGVKDQWRKISEALPGRTNKACRKRWLHSLSPNVKKSLWTPEEDALLIKLNEEFPGRWALIARQIPGRTDDACSKRYREALDPNLRKDEWTQDEDVQLLREVTIHKSQWTKVGAAMNRSGLACRNRHRMLQRRKPGAVNPSVTVSVHHPHQPVPSWQPPPPPVAMPVAPINTGWTPGYAFTTFTNPLAALHAPPEPGPSRVMQSPQDTIAIDPRLRELNPPYVPVADVSPVSSVSPVDTHEQFIHARQPYYGHPPPPPAQSIVSPPPRRDMYHHPIPVRHQVYHPPLSAPLPPQPPVRDLREHFEELESPGGDHYDDSGPGDYDPDPHMDVDEPSRSPTPDMPPPPPPAPASVPTPLHAPAPMRGSMNASLAHHPPTYSSPSLPAIIHAALIAEAARPPVPLVSASAPAPTPVTTLPLPTLPLPTRPRSETPDESESPVEPSHESMMSSFNAFNAGGAQSKRKYTKRKRPDSDDPASGDPRLSASRNVTTSADVLAYGCGFPGCWEKVVDERDQRLMESPGNVRFTNSALLLAHTRVAHSNEEIDKMFRCALENCGKAWKNINGIQYHLQVSKAHFKAAVDSAQREKLEGVDDGAMFGEKKFRCKHIGCLNAYRQASGLRYHLRFGHPEQAPSQLSELPPQIKRKLAGT